MDMFANLLEILAPSPAPKEPIQNQVIEVGSEIALRAINGDIFNCFILVPMKNAGSTLARCKYILAITDSQIVELYPHSIKPGVAVAAEVHDLQALVKLKFKKGEQGILLLEYKNGKVSKLLMDDPAVCVNNIKERMKNMGINGSIKDKTERILENAQGFFEQAKEIETQFSLSPSVEYVQEMMDLLRKATEKFAEANDNHYMEVMDFIKHFLQRPDVNSVLDASVKTPAKVPVGAKDTPQRTDSLSTRDVTTPQLASAGSQYRIDLPDIDAELSTLRNAFTYHFEEDDHHEHSSPTRRPADRNSAHATPALATAGKTTSTEKCELTEMLDKMQFEFDSLLSSFEGEGEARPVTEIDESGADFVPHKLDTNQGATEAGGAEGTDVGFLEVDFDQTLEEIVKSP
jgi:hypothetical protein